MALFLTDEHKEPFTLAFAEAELSEALRILGECPTWNVDDGESWVDYVFSLRVVNLMYRAV